MNFSLETEVECPCSMYYLIRMFFRGEVVLIGPLGRFSSKEVGPVRYHLGWGGERNTLYKGMETSP